MYLRFYFLIRRWVRAGMQRFTRKKRKSSLAHIGSGGSSGRFSLEADTAILYPNGDGSFVGPLLPPLKETTMAETIRKSSTPAKPRKTTSKKKLAEVTELVPRVAEAASSTSPQTSHEQVALLAHSYFTERGKLHGHHEEDWFRAEHELRQKLRGKAS
jgi:Protein of unknown function (DUF2934)